MFLSRNNIQTSSVSSVKFIKHENEKFIFENVWLETMGLVVGP